MFYEAIIGLGLLLYMFCKFLWTKKLSDSDVLETTVDEINLIDAVDNKSFSSEDVDEVDKLSKNERAEGSCDINTDFEKNLPRQIPTVNNSVEIPDLTTLNDLYDDSAVQNKTCHKRASPPKERLTEFLEKTILNDEKLQSIFQNLSLNTDFGTEVESRKSLDFTVNRQPNESKTFESSKIENGDKLQSIFQNLSLNTDFGTEEPRKSLDFSENRQSNKSKTFEGSKIENDDKLQPIFQNLSLNTDFGTEVESLKSLDFTENRQSNESKTFGGSKIENDDKLQSVFQNLSLSTDFVTEVEPRKSLDFTENRQSHESKTLEDSKIERTVDELVSVDAIKDNEINRNYIIQKEENVNIENKPLLKRLQTQPAGFHFGSVIGELKSKTKNGGLKPVFKKFETDDVDTTQESLNSVDDKKKVHIDDNELGPNILADRRNKLETAAQGWRKRVPQTDASNFTVAGRLERDKVVATPPATPPPAAPLVASPGIPPPNKFRSRKAPTSPTNGFASGPLRSASCAVVSAKEVEVKPPAPRVEREPFKRSHSASESVGRVDETDESPGAEKSGSAVRIPKADDENFHAFFAPLQSNNAPAELDLDLDLDAIDSGSRQMLAGEWARRAKRERKHVASRNPLKALAARTDLRQEYLAQPSTIRDQFIKEKATANCGLAAEALAALASKEDFSNVALRSASSNNVPSHGTKALMLMQVKGRRRVQTRLVEPIASNVNRGDCFLLVTPEQVFLYIGLYANVIERNRSTDIALHIHNTKDLGCKNSTGVIKIDEQTKNYSNKHWNQFWSLLGVTEDIENYKPAEAGHADEDEIFESCIVQTNMCYEVSDDELVPIKEYWGQLPKIAMLHQSKIIVFDFGSEMYIWYGKNVPLESRRRAAQLAQELYDDGYNYEECHINPLNAAAYQGDREESNPPEKAAKSRPEWTILSKVTQHMETILFKEKFLDWPDYTRVIKVKPQENKTNSVEISPCDAEEMWSNEYQDPDLVLEGSHLGRGTHYYDKDSMRHYDIKTKSVCKWVIREYDYQKVENDSDVGEFFSGDSYIIRWEYQITVTGRELNGKPSKHNLTGRDRCAYFCWQGRDASSNEKGAAALLTVELDKEKGPQVRVAQGTEPPVFLNLFQGNLLIHQGKKGIDNSRYKLFVTRGNVSNEAYLLQVPCSVRQLRSRGSLLLIDTENAHLYIWHGSRSLKHTKSVAIELANKLIARKCTYLFGDKVNDVKITEVKEGKEPKDVLDALGVANKQYYNTMLSREVSGDVTPCADVTPRLFHFTDLGGQFEANEVLSPLRHEHLVTPYPFEQRELYSASQPALFLLDDGQAVWLWQGWWPRGEDGELEPAEINAGVGAFASRWQSLRVAALRTCETYCALAKRGDARVVCAGLEPSVFARLFDVWAEHDEAADANIAHGYKAGEIMSGKCELSRLASCDALLPLAALQRRPLPDHVNPHHLERHLTSPDFMEAFGMTKEEFAALPAWKQTNLKKDVGLF